MKAIPILIFSVLALIKATAEEAVLPPIGDSGLRAFLNISSVFSQTSPPQGASTYICTFAKFESGEFKGFGGYLDSPITDRAFLADLVWGPSGDTTAWALATNNARSGGRKDDPFFDHIRTSGWRRYEMRDRKTLKPITYRGYIVLEIGTDGADANGIDPEVDLLTHLKQFKHAVVLLVQFFDTHEAYLEGVNAVRKEINKGQQVVRGNGG